MKSAKALFTVSILLITLLLANCSKEKKLERTLHKKEGEWSVTSVTWQKVVQDTSGQSVTIGTAANAGTFTFEKDGSGKYNFTVGGSTYSQTFNWSVKDDAISLTKASQTFDFSGNFSQIAISMSGSQTGKTSIELEGSETHQYSSGSVTQHVISGTFSLTKK